MNGKTGFVPWDKLDTTPTSCTDKEARALAFDKNAAIRKTIISFQNRCA